MSKPFLLNYMKAQSETGLRNKLRVRQAKLGASLKVVSVYKDGSSIVCWYYDEVITPEEKEQVDKNEQNQVV